jgi:hypothetical protein
LGNRNALLCIFKHQDQGQAVGTGALPRPAAADVFTRSQLNGGFNGLPIWVGTVDELSPEPLTVAANEPPAAAVEEFPARLKGFRIGCKAEEIIGGGNCFQDSVFSGQDAAFRA